MMCAITNYDMFARLKLEIEPKATRHVAPAHGGGKLRKLRRKMRRKPRSKSAAPPVMRKTTRNKSGAKSDSEL